MVCVCQVRLSQCRSVSSPLVRQSTSYASLKRTDSRLWLSSDAHKLRPQAPNPSSWSERAWRARGQKFDYLSVCIYPPGFVSEGVRICAEGRMQLPLYINLKILQRERHCNLFVIDQREEDCKYLFGSMTCRLYIGYVF